MFGQRQRNKNTPKLQQQIPQQEPNRSSILSPEIDEPNSLPSSVTEIMSIVRLSWDFMTSSDFNAIPYALSLIDGSSLGSDYASFLDVYQGVEKAMDVVVNGSFD
jgi:exocyst complex component 4